MMDSHNKRRKKKYGLRGGAPSIDLGQNERSHPRHASIKGKTRGREERLDQETLISATEKGSRCRRGVKTVEKLTKKAIQRQISSRKKEGGT